MKQRILFFVLLATLTLAVASCSAIPGIASNPTAVPATEVPPTIKPPTAVPPTAIPATAVPPTKEIVKATEKPASPHGTPDGCVDVLTITKAQVGKSVCMWGIISRTAGGKGDYYLYFEGATKETIFFMAASWLPTPGVKSPNTGDCVYLENKEVSQFGQALIAYFQTKELKTCTK